MNENENKNEQSAQKKPLSSVEIDKIFDLIYQEKIEDLISFITN